MKKIKFRISKDGFIKTESPSPIAGQILCEASGMEDHCTGDCCDVPSKPVKEPVIIRITQEGQAFPEWWTPAASQLLCTVCGGDREECERAGRFLSCSNLEEFCG